MIAATRCACLSLLLVQAATLDTVVPRHEAADSARIVAHWAALDAAWNARDAQRFSEHFAPDATLEFVDRGQAFDGRAAILRNFQQQFRSQHPALRHRSRVRDMRAVAPDVATVDGTVEILRSVGGAGAEFVIVRTFAIFAVMQRTAGAWTIRALRVYEVEGSASV